MTIVAVRMVPSSGACIHELRMLSGKFSQRSFRKSTVGISAAEAPRPGAGVSRCDREFQVILERGGRRRRAQRMLFGTIAGKLPKHDRLRHAK